MALARDAWVNIEANKLACMAIKDVTPGPIQYCIPHSSCVCYLDDMHLVKQFKSQLWTYVDSPTAVEYWLCHWQLTPQIWQTVDGETLDKMYKSAPLDRQCWALKYALGHFSHGKNMVWWKFHSMAKCPQCAFLVEG